MDDEELMGRVRALREKGSSPKEIARALGMKPSAVAPLVRALAAAEQASPAERRVAECWVGSGWSGGLTVDGHPEWLDVDGGADEVASGLVGVLVARDAGRSRVSACCYLVDVYCLGVKNTIGPDVMGQHSLTAYARAFFSGCRSRPLAAPVELAQHLVLGAVKYARSLGFEPPPGSDFDKTRGHLEPWAGPSAITFGREGKPLYIEGPYDNPARVVKTLEHAVGAGNFDYLIGLGQPTGTPSTAKRALARSADRLSLARASS